MTYGSAVVECRERYGNSEISDAAALALCAAWASSGHTGWTLAAVATGAWSPESLVNDTPGDIGETRGDLFRTDLYRTFRGSASDSEERLVWSMLGTWSIHGSNDE